MNQYRNKELASFSQSWNLPNCVGLANLAQTLVDMKIAIRLDYAKKTKNNKGGKKKTMAKKRKKKKKKKLIKTALTILISTKIT